MTKAICILSGGMDSCVVVHHLKKETEYKDIICVTFDYKQKHKKEIECAKNIAESLSSEWILLNFSFPNSVLAASSLTGTTEIPEGVYNEESMRSTVVPNRNTIMLSIGWSIMVSLDAVCLACGVHAGDHFIYPDCRPEYIYSLTRTLRLGTKGHHKPNSNLYTPFLHLDKRNIIKKGIELGVDFSKTWTCYKGEELACGKCGSCNERLEAFKALKITDPLEYVC